MTPERIKEIREDPAAVVNWTEIYALLDAYEDAQRLDWLEGEAAREQQAVGFAESLFRKNVPITRAAIDAARTA